ncbi:MAG: homocysteine S-methyltransferase family protein [Alphaproteobacteria bacterium]|mgnify:CR=1 FL=1|jgi:S-methylmethionine-dependent homocysteine/selenocysteine methylase|nr:homocysteine S-methyltransferase family protein [Rhodospirillaceae bacterium]MBT6512491.1 homocysteine S-methyltransferase family protein [Rhodospirillaceae bacterium]MBT7614899.1 homocysteine S-methyltransferase family protein [Rhodospirillaceae bacterium]MBT7648659.1 homocysteine S-methyltransferase family protein [Rhodospirillaceae bacterium]MDG2480655.1 homocysteine S-methyltransferase family protein [Alphaproteobacteria bacterium]
MSAWKDKLDNGEILLIDGAMGTELERRGVPMSAISWSGTSLVENPEEIIAAHEDYIRAGAEVIITNTFGVGPYLLEELGYADRVDELIRSAGELAQRARDNVGIDVAIAGSIADPGIRNRDWVRDAPEPGEQEMLDSAGRMATQLAAGGCDLIALEMMMDTVVATIGLKAAKATGLPVWMGLSVRWNEAGDTLIDHNGSGKATLDDMLDAWLPHEPDAINVMHTAIDATGPALDVVRARYDGPMGAYPESGYFTMPNWQFVDIIAPDDLIREARGWVGQGATILGGCCGLGPEHIIVLRDAIPSMKPAA